MRENSRTKTRKKFKKYLKPKLIEKIEGRQKPVLQGFSND